MHDLLHCLWGRPPDPDTQRLQDDLPGGSGSAVASNFTFTLLQNSSQPWGAVCGGPIYMGVHVPDNATLALAAGQGNAFSNYL